MNTQYPKIDARGSLQFGPLPFDEWIICRTCSPLMEKLYHDLDCPIEHTFLCGAFALAKEVRGTGYDWSHASAVYASAAREQAIDERVIERLLELSWRWAGAGFNHWSDLVRHFVCVGENHQFCFVPTGEALTELEFGAMFNGLSPLRGVPIVDFLLEDGEIQIVSGLLRRPKLEHAFYGKWPEAVLNIPMELGAVR